jgi:DNA replication and repair protein RecF
MRLTRIRAADFRNLTFADVSVDAPRVFLIGENGQGKTNLLEAAALISSFRSFRTTEISPLIRAGCTEARLRLDVRVSANEQAEVELRLAKGSRKALLNGSAVTSVAQHLGQFPTIVFCSDDLRLVRGSPANRRRWLDAAIGGTDAAYLNALRDYTRALEGRNALLKSEIRSDEELRAFEKAMLPPGQLIATIRAKVIPELAETLRLACARAGFPDKGADLIYQPDTAAEELEATRSSTSESTLSSSTSSVDAAEEIASLRAQLAEARALIALQQAQLVRREEELNGETAISGRFVRFRPTLLISSSSSSSSSSSPSPSSPSGMGWRS